MSDRVLRPRVRNGSTPNFLSENSEKSKLGASKEVMQNLINTVAQERFTSSQQQQRRGFKKRVVFSNKRYTSDDLSSSRSRQQLDPPEVTPVGILKRGRRPAAKQALHSSFTEAGDGRGAQGGWQSASSSILAALSLAVSPLARQRARQAERVARQDETVRRVISFYKNSGEWWNVFPKTDYSYSKFSSFHREISPGVITVPNMSRTSLRHSGTFFGGKVGSEETPIRRPLHHDSYSDNDEVDECQADFISTTIKRSLMSQQGTLSTWMRIRNLFWTLFTSILTIILTPVKFVSSLGSRSFSSGRKAEKIRSYYSSRYEQKSFLSRLWFPFHWLFSNMYILASHILVSDTFLLSKMRSSWRSHPSSSQKGCNKWFLILLLLPLLIFIGWWLLKDASLSTISQTTSSVLESTQNVLWTCLTIPVSAVQYLISQLSTVMYSVLTAPLKVLPSAESFISLLYDILMSPLLLLRSICDIFLSAGWSVVSLFQMLFAAMPSSKATNYEVLPSDDIKTLVDAALREQEASLLARMAEQGENLQTAFTSRMFQQEENINARLASKEIFQQKLNAKILYLQDELRSLRRRLIMCCRRSVVVPSQSHKDKLHELRQLLSSPEGLVLLGAAVAHTNSLDRTLSSVPQFNDTEIRAWISTAFLEKDDFERSLENMTKYFHEELERRSAIMMSASSEEINAIISRQMQFHTNQMYKLRSELASSNRFQNDHLQTGASFTSSETAAALDESRVRRIVDTALSLYDADKTGMADYALESQGGQVISTRCTETYQVKSPTLSVFGVPLWYPSNSPRTVIQPGMHPGECWAFVGSQGFLVIELSHRIRVKGFTYEHISPVLLPTGKMDSAPKDFSVHGLRSEGDNEPILLGNYHYLENGTSMQYFPVQRLSAQPLQLIEIQVKSNHGNINYTCMYRFRVHGSIA